MNRTILMLLTITIGHTTAALSQVSSQPEQVRYRVTFNSTWSKTSHPKNFPRNPHFSGLVGVTHSPEVLLWKNDHFASRGLELVAETGGKTVINQEIDQLIKRGSAQFKISGAGIPNSPGKVAVNFNVTRTYSKVSLVSMLAPSPDWFVGVSGLELYKDNKWLTKKVIPLAVYDSGTDSGKRFVSGDQNTSPANLISRLTSSASDTDFKNGEKIIGTFTFERIK